MFPSKVQFKETEIPASEQPKMEKPEILNDAKDNLSEWKQNVDGVENKLEAFNREPEGMDDSKDSLSEWKPNESNIEKKLEDLEKKPEERPIDESGLVAWGFDRLPALGNEKNPDVRLEDHSEAIEEKGEVASKSADISFNTILPQNGGEWSGERGNSRWWPSRDEVPKDRHGTNPEHKTWGEILDEHGIESISFVNGYPDFSEVSKGQVEIDDFTDDRRSNFTQADEKLAEQRGCAPQEVKGWRDIHGYTWHECEDCRTMLKVPTEVHGNVSHSGGVSVYKSQHADT